MSQTLQSLPAGTELDGYRFERVLGGGGFSIVYLGTELASGQVVVIKEYLPERLAERNGAGQVVPRGAAEADKLNRGRKLFFQEASILAKLQHPNIVQVLTFFQDNGTVYMVMPFEEGKNLQDYLQARKGRLSERFLRTVFPPLLDGLALLHARDILHLDIKPGNIHIRPGGQPLLLDFGAVHGFGESRRAQPGQVISPGFSPVEQYEPNGYVGPWTDIYAIGATMRACIEGRAPIDARERRMRDELKPTSVVYRKRYSDGLLQAIDWAMEVDPLLRPQNIAAFQEALLRDTEPAEEEPVSTLGRLANTLLGKG
jgi:serine/threonine protein kinase